jgi:hypothetical protein
VTGDICVLHIDMITVFVVGKLWQSFRVQDLQIHHSTTIEALSMKFLTFLLQLYALIQNDFLKSPYFGAFTCKTFNSEPSRVRTYERLPLCLWDVQFKKIIGTLSLSLFFDFFLERNHIYYYYCVYFQFQKSIFARAMEESEFLLMFCLMSYDWCEIFFFYILRNTI